MPLTKLNTTVAVLALTAGTAFAQSTSSTDPAPAIDTSPTRQAQSDNNSVQDSTEGDDPFRYTEENVRDATEGQVNIADEGESDFSDAEPVLSGDVDDDETVAVDELRENSDVTAGDVVSTGESDVAGRADIADESDSTDQAAAGSDAQTTDMSEASQEPNENTITLADLTAGDLEGREIYDSQGELIGEIYDVVEINGETAALVEVGGFLFFGGREVAISMDEIDVNIDDRLNLTATSKEDFEAREGIDKSQARPLEPTDRLTN